MQDALPKENQAKLVTLSTDPDNDTAAVLKTYAEHNGADSSRWMFLTGTKREIGNLARNGLKLASVEVDSGERTAENDLFVHSTIFVVVDKHSRLRGVFETGGEGVDWPAGRTRPGPRTCAATGSTAATSCPRSGPTRWS